MQLILTLHRPDHEEAAVKRAELWTMALSSVDIDAPRWDQATFMGRLRHFFNITDCRTALLPDSRLDEAKALVEGCR